MTQREYKVMHRIKVYTQYGLSMIPYCKMITFHGALDFKDFVGELN